MTLPDFRRIRAQIQPYIRMTPVVPAEFPNLFLKLENIQYTHAFKVRGAFAHILGIVACGDTRTILTVSAGNHGQAVALAARLRGIPAYIVMPETAPAAKRKAVEDYGGRVTLASVRTIGELPVTTTVSSMSAICIVTFIVMVLLSSTFAPS